MEARLGYACVHEGARRAAAILCDRIDAVVHVGLGREKHAHAPDVVALHCQEQ